MEKVSAQAKVQILRNDLENLEERIEQHFRATDKKVDNHEDILINKGKGIVYRVGKLETAADASSNTYSKVTATLAVLLSAIAVLLQILEKMK